MPRHGRGLLKQAFARHMSLVRTASNAMNGDGNHSASTTFRLWVRKAVVTFSVGVVCGAVVIPLLHRVFYGQADPFRQGWPFCLHASAFLSSLIIAYLFRCTTGVALAVYAGLAGPMLVSGQSEYPISSAISLLIHGFIPAALGSITAFVAINNRASVPSGSATEKVPRPRGRSGFWK